MQPYEPSPADVKRYEALCAAGEHDRLSEEFLAVLSHYERRLYVSDATFADTLFPFLDFFLATFIRPDYVIAERYATDFIRRNTLLSNLVAMSPRRHTDAALETLRDAPGSLAKILTLYSARNHARFDRDRFFAEHAPLASLWYHQYCGIHSSGLVREDVVARLSEHLGSRNERLLPAWDMMYSYYGCTYVDGERDLEFKRFLNLSVRRHLGFRLDQAPDPRKIAVISDLWFPTHSVYRNYAAYVQSLRPHYHLTLFHAITPRDNLDTGMFDDVCRLDMSNRDGLMRQLSGNFQLAYFPDVGMTDPSIFLSNCRIAPIQLCSPGHSVSTGGSEIDYFISGADVETRDAPERHYCERLVLLPGMGVIHNPPRYEPSGRSRGDAAEIIINCPWSGHKMCARFLGSVRRLLQRTTRPVRLRIFPNDGILLNNGYLPFLVDLHAALGESAAIELLPGLPYGKYMQLMEEGDLTLDSFHFAGCNTVADSLFLRKPTLVWEGDKWYNRIGPAMLRRIAVEDCICRGEEEYLEKALLLVHDDAKRAEITARLKAADIHAALFGTQDASAFRRAVEYLIAHHAQLQGDGSRAALRIS